MCLAVPAEVLAVSGEEATVALDGVKLTISTALTPDLAPGDWALVHVGFALSRIDPIAEAATLAALRAAAGAAS